VGACEGLLGLVGGGVQQWRRLWMVGGSDPGGQVMSGSTMPEAAYRWVELGVLEGWAGRGCGAVRGVGRDGGP